MSTHAFRALNELSLFAVVTGAVVAAVLAALGQADQSLIGWAAGVLATGGLAIVVNASLEQFRLCAAKAGVR